jgi:stearoyl-CoA desaturase (Delta-9 desaturase)
MIRKRVLRTGDGSHRYSKAKTAKELVDAFNNNSNNNNNEEEPVDTLWGWGDDDMDAEEVKDVKILHPKFGV